MSQCRLFPETLQQGYIYKQSKRIGVFRKRYIVIENNKLWSYKSDKIFHQNQEHYTEVFDLNIYSTAQITVNKYYIKQFEFSIFSDAGDSRRFRCNSECELKQWMRSIHAVHHHIQQNHLLLHFAGIKPPETCITTTHLHDIKSLITIQSTLTVNDTVSALKNVIRKTYGIPSHKDILIIYSHTIISNDDDATLQRHHITTNSLLLLAVNADKRDDPYISCTDSATSISSSVHLDSSLPGWYDMRSVSTPPTPMRRNYGYLNLPQLALAEANSTLSALDTHRRPSFTSGINSEFSVPVTPPRTMSDSNDSLPPIHSAEAEYSMHLETMKGFDIITQEDNVLVYRMPCGHWMNRQSLYEYAMSVFGEHYNTRICLKCPHSMENEKELDGYWSCHRCTYYNTYDITRCEICSAPKPERSKLCDVKWDYLQIKKILTDPMEEKEAVDSILVHKLVKLELYNARNVMENKCNVQRCTECDTLYYRESEDDDTPLFQVTDRNDLEQRFKTQCTMCAKSTFCWLCGAKWDNGHFCDFSFRLELVDILKRAKSKTIDGVIDVPSIRCCPHCCLLIKHSDACKHMKCKACNTDFCFICLKEKKHGKWQCGFVCAVAQRQRADTLPMNKKRFKLF